VSSKKGRHRRHTHKFARSEPSGKHKEEAALDEIAAQRWAKAENSQDEHDLDDGPESPMDD
jgi:hypothetical protein